MGDASEADLIRGVADRQAILDVVTRYFTAIDRRDFDRLRTCFTDDVEAVYEGVRVAGGIDRIMAFCTGRSEIRFPIEIVDMQTTMHFIGNHTASVDGDHAEAETYALAHLVDRPPTGLRLRTRGLRYLDQLVRVDDGRWLIRRREHVLDWMKTESLSATGE